jgi:hypothetical protein
MDARVPGICIDCSQGNMNSLAEPLNLVKLLKNHIDPGDEFHMDEHQVVCVGHQFKDGVTFMTLTTHNFLNTMARADNCGFERKVISTEHSIGATRISH